MYRFSARSLERMVGVDQRLIESFTLALSVSPLDFGIPKHGGIRTAEEQNELYRAGVSKADGYKNKSYHQTGKALDFYALYRGNYSAEPEHYALVAAAILQSGASLGYALEWGGLFRSFFDGPHIQIPKTP